MNIRDFYNFVEDNDIDLDTEISLICKKPTGILIVNDVQHILRDFDTVGNEVRIVLLSDYLD